MTGEADPQLLTIPPLRENAEGLPNRLDLPFGRINYTVWSDVFVCPECSGEVVFWDVAVDQKASKIYEEFPCPHCFARLTKKRLDRAWATGFDPAIGETVRQVRQVPVLSSYKVGKKRFEKAPDDFDIALIREAEKRNIPYWFPTDWLPTGYNTQQPKRSHGTTRVHHFYTKRDLTVVAATLEKAKLCRTKSLLFLSVTSLVTYASKLSRWRVGNKSGPLSGTLYISSTIMPLDALTILPNRFRRMAQAKRSLPSQLAEQATIAAQSSTNLNIQSNSADYIFTDPPFGGNIMYSAGL